MRRRNLAKNYWKTADGRYVKIKNLTDDHLHNILKKGLSSGKDIRPEILTEAKLRGWDIKEYEKKYKKIPNIDLLQRIETLEKKIEQLENLIKI